MAEKLLVTVAPCVPPYIAKDIPGLDLSPEGIADEVMRAHDAGANVVHLHVWDEQGQPTTELLAFERKYGIRSETFYAAYASGEEPEDDQWVLDFGEWASVYRTWLARQAEYRNKVQRLQTNAPSVAGLIRVASA